VPVGASSPATLTRIRSPAESGISPDGITAGVGAETVTAQRESFSARTVLASPAGFSGMSAR
jgi:hypothetical protein